MKAEQIEQFMRQGLPAADEVGLKVDYADHEKAVVRYPFNNSMVRPGGTVSGPTMMSLADAAMYAAILARLESAEMAVTSNLNINFLRRPKQSDLIAHAEIIQIGRRSIVLEVKVYSEGEPKMVAHVTGTYARPLN